MDHLNSVKLHRGDGVMNTDSKKSIVNLLGFKLLFTLLSTLIVVINYSGNDDKNILLFITSPPFWLIENYFRFFTITHIYIFTILFWVIFGILLDYIILKMKDKFMK